MVSTFKPDNSAEYVDGLDRHFYEKQIGPASPFDETHAFRLAAARAKDRARHQLVRAVLREAGEARARRDFATEISESFDRENYNKLRTIDGVQGAPDEAIKL